MFGLSKTLGGRLFHIATVLGKNLIGLISGGGFKVGFYVIK